MFPALRCQRGVTARRGVDPVHRGRSGGNARKRKSKLNDDIFQAMIAGPTTVADRSPLVTPGVDLGDQFDPLPGAAVATLEVEASRVFQRPRRVITGVDDLQDYAFGYARCRHCQSDQVYYLHSADLERGYTFRCRICRLEITVSAATPASD
jgi:hypothetical protein